LTSSEHRRFFARYLPSGQIGGSFIPTIVVIKGYDPN